jgi:hypothetical protein
MRIAFDVHGTIDTSPEVFKPMMKMFMRSGVDVVIFSGPPKEQIYNELVMLDYERGIHFNSIYSVVDYLKCIEVPMTQDDKGNWWCDEKPWWKAKGLMCESVKVDMVIDNDFRYQHDIEKHAKFIHWDSRLKEKM